MIPILKEVIVRVVTIVGVVGLIALGMPMNVRMNPPVNGEYIMTVALSVPPVEQFEPKVIGAKPDLKLVWDRDRDGNDDEFDN